MKSAVETVEYLDPSDIIAAGNIRLNINAGPLDLLMRDITAQGGVQEPVTVEVVGDEYRLVKGFRRHAAVAKLNEQGAGLKLPAIIREYATDTDRLKAQVAENVVRESLSPIDTAISMRRLLDSGMTKVEVRELFSRATPKGSKPLSNAQVNIYLNMLDLPKPIQSKIHDGRVGVKAAYELSKVAPEHQADVLARAEAEAEKEAAQEEKEETRFLKALQREQKTAEREAADAAKLEKLDAAIVETRAEVKQAEKLYKEKNKAADAAEKAKGKDFRKLPTEKQKEINESIKAAEKDVQAIAKQKKDGENKLAKLLEQKNKLTAVEEETEEEAPAPKKAKPVSDTQVKAAAKAVTGNGAVPLNLSEVKVALKDISKATTPRTAEVGKTLLALLSGELTTKEAIHFLGVATGEVKKK